MDTIQQLISGYLDNELSDSEAEQLASALTTNVSLVDEFVIDAVIHTQLLDLMDEKLLQERVIGEVVSDDAGGELLPQPLTMAFDNWPMSASSRVPRGSGFRRWTHLQRWGTLAAALLVAATFSALGYVVFPRPAYVGTLTEASDARWGVAPPGIAVGTFLEDGQELELITGNAVITFSSGAKLYLEGPTTLQVDSPKDIRLVSGRIAAKVPRPAVGFTVQSALAEFVDLGTEFELQLSPQKSFQLHVYEGLVEVRLDERFGSAAKRPARIAEVRAVTFDVTKGDVETLPFKEGKEMPF
jgi:hypothetical protein